MLNGTGVSSFLRLPKGIFWNILFFQNVKSFYPSKNYFPENDYLFYEKNGGIPINPGGANNNILK